MEGRLYKRGGGAGEKRRKVARFVLQTATTCIVVSAAGCGSLSPSDLWQGALLCSGLGAGNRAAQLTPPSTVVGDAEVALARESPAGWTSGRWLSSGAGEVSLSIGHFSGGEGQDSCLPGKSHLGCRAWPGRHSPLVRSNPGEIQTSCSAGAFPGSLTTTCLSSSHLEARSVLSQIPNWGNVGAALLRCHGSNQGRL